MSPGANFYHVGDSRCKERVQLSALLCIVRGSLGDFSSTAISYLNVIVIVGGYLMERRFVYKIGQAQLTKGYLNLWCGVRVNTWT